MLSVLPARAGEDLASELRRQLGSSELAGASVGVLVVELGSGRTVLEHRSAQSFVPASNQKIFVAYAALDLLGPEHRFSTPLYRLGKIQDGVLWGDLYLVGRGDPGLTTAGLYELAASLRSAGIRRIAGDLVVDDTGFSLPQQYVGGPAAKVYYTPNGALSLNYNTVCFTIEGTLAGQPATIAVDPPGRFVQVSGRVLTRESTSVSVTRSALRDANRFSLSGSIAAGETERLVRAVTSPTRHTVEAFLAALDDLGVERTGQVRAGALPSGGVELHALASAPVSELVFDLNKLSNNFLGDQLALLLGERRYGAPATWDKARRGLQEYLEGLGLEDTLVSDGSGLSGGNRTSPKDLLAVLCAAPRRPFWPEFVASLPIGGRDGTIHDRLTGPELFGRVRAKTGTLTGVSTLSGYVFRDDGRSLAFAILINGHRSGLWGAQSVQDRMLGAMLLRPVD
jgi:D-alanyl-D-alanine carboxypeptidase/D-alanyl-D-alanine-endopeptidase (penicillin-binding protein 4)